MQEERVLTFALEVIALVKTGVCCFRDLKKSNICFKQERALILGSAPQSCLT